MFVCLFQEHEIQETMRPLQEEWNNSRPPLAKMLSLVQALCVVCLAVSTEFNLWLSHSRGCPIVGEGERSYSSTQTPLAVIFKVCFLPRIFNFVIRDFTFIGSPFYYFWLLKFVTLWLLLWYFLFNWMPLSGRGKDMIIKIEGMRLCIKDQCSSSTYEHPIHFSVWVYFTNFVL